MTFRTTSFLCRMRGMKTIAELLKKPSAMLLLLMTVVFSYFTYFHRYWYPPDFFWDENYHITSAQKYLNGTFFMQGHPPLGKMLLAAGESILSPNTRTDQFIDTDYARDKPMDFSFTGFRLFPALMSWLGAPLLFLSFLLITRSAWTAFFMNFIYIFDNALIVHNRGAMLEGPFVFFAILSILLFLLTIEERNKKRAFYISSFLLGIACGLTFMTKLLGLIFILFVPAMLLWLYKKPKDFIKFITLYSAGFLLMFVGIWHLHFTLATEINPELHTNGYYMASDEYKAILANGTNGSITNFPVMLRDQLAFIRRDNYGVPTLNLCKEDENGSPFFYWPFGARSINYRWNTPDSVFYQYLYLQANPIGWFFALLGIFLAGAFIATKTLFAPKLESKNWYLILTFFGMYASYMVAIGMITRVMYLYHYFVPLILSFVLFGLMFEEIRFIGLKKLNPYNKFCILIGISMMIFASFWFYSPLTYYLPLNKEQFKLRSIVPIWDLRCVNCEDRTTLYFPQK